MRFDFWQSREMEGGKVNVLQSNDQCRTSVIDKIQNVMVEVY